MMSRKNTEISVVTVNFNNSIGLHRTLESLTKITTLPNKIIIIDAASTDNSLKVAREYEQQLPLEIYSRPDNGIYDGMNKGLRYVTSGFVHYLNSGDAVYGDPYGDLCSESLLPVRIIDANGEFISFDYVKLFGFGYNHQGIIFKSNHRNYDTRLKLAADRDLILRHFPKGLKRLMINRNGGVLYYLDGISTEHARLGDLEILRSFFNNRPAYFLQVLLFLLLKSLCPRPLRRLLMAPLSAFKKV